MSTYQCTVHDIGVCCLTVKVYLDWLRSRRTHQSTIDLTRCLIVAEVPNQQMLSGILKQSIGDKQPIDNRMCYQVVSILALLIDVVSPQCVESILIYWSLAGVPVFCNWKHVAPLDMITVEGMLSRWLCLQSGTTSAVTECSWNVPFWRRQGGVNSSLYCDCNAMSSSSNWSIP